MLQRNAACHACNDTTTVAPRACLATCAATAAAPLAQAAAGAGVTRAAQPWVRRQTSLRTAIDDAIMSRSAGQAQGGAPAATFVLVSSSSRRGKPDAQPAATDQQPRIQQREQFITSSGGAGAADHAAGQLPSPLLPPPRTRRLLRWSVAGAGIAAVAAGVTLIVLWKVGVLSGGNDDDWQPLAYAQRQRTAAALPAFSADLHPWLLPSEQAALGLQLDADVIIVGAGVAGLQAALTLPRSMRVLVLEARVSGPAWGIAASDVGAYSHAARPLPNVQRCFAGPCKDDAEARLRS